MAWSLLALALAMSPAGCGDALPGPPDLLEGTDMAAALEPPSCQGLADNKCGPQ